MNSAPRPASPDAPWRLDRLALRKALGYVFEPLPTQIRSISAGLYGPDGKPLVSDVFSEEKMRPGR